ncbi:MAG: hypothetical protein IJB52_04485 [Clostridia bacterium]|nr:hypothetical protein [Clostridia bacterium]
MTGSRMSRTEKLLIVSVILVFVVLMAAMVLTVMLNSAASGTLYSDPPFAISSLISDVEKESTDVSPGEYLQPAFIGVTPASGGKGISAGDNVIRELYDMLVPCLAAGLAGEPAEETAVNWAMLARSSRAVYIRYHSALSVPVLQAAAAAVAGLDEESGGETVMPLRELFILLPDEQYGDCQIILRDTEGLVWRYLCRPQEEYPTLAQVQGFVEGLAGSFFRFRLIQQEDGAMEPVFLERMRVRNILLTPGTAVMMQENRVDDLKKLLLNYNFNPDKLNTHEEADGTQVIVEAHGVFRTQNDSLTYTAGTDGGIAMQHFIGYQEEYTLSDSLRTACTIIEDLREIHPYYLGGDAEPVLTEVSLAEGQLRMVFRYAFDNLLLDGCRPAAVVVTEEDKVISVELYATAIRSLGDFDSSFLEYGLLDWDVPTGYTDVTLTYPAGASGNNIYPVWTFYGKNGREDG